jgi:DNA-binding CsgD family transcriptional regulator
VVQLLGEGRTSKEVASTLGVTLKTARTHRGNVMLKLKLHSIAELVLYAVRNEIVHVQLPSGLRLPNLTGVVSQRIN